MLIALGGFFGAIARYLVYLLVENRSRHPKTATLLVNCLGSLALGALVGSGQLSIFWITGFLGAFTTFSTMALDALKDFEEGKWRSGILYLTANLLGGIILFGTAYTLIQ